MGEKANIYKNFTNYMPQMIGGSGRQASKIARKKFYGLHLTLVP
jgi:hypothetical protein